MAIAPLPTRDLLGVFKDNRLATVSNYWRTVGGLAVHQSTRPEIIFEKITSSRRIAPHVLPANTGKPTLVKQGSAAQMFSPGYIKAKDPVLPGEQFSRQPGDLFTDVPRTPQANFDMAVADVVAYHRQIIERRCAKTKIGQADIAKHWFVDQKGPWSTAEEEAYRAMHKGLKPEHSAE